LVLALLRIKKATKERSFGGSAGMASSAVAPLLCVPEFPLVCSEQR
jgi:hypothetical protein